MGLWEAREQIINLPLGTYTGGDVLLFSDGRPPVVREFRDMAFRTLVDPGIEFSCTMFEPPLITDDEGTGEVERLTIGDKSKRTIPVKTPLQDEDGFVVTLLDIPASGDGVVRPPVISVSFSSIASGDGIVDESALLNPGSADDDNVFRFDEFDQKWIHNLRTKYLTAPGTYTIVVVSGDSDAYTVNQDSCTISFERTW